MRNSALEDTGVEALGHTEVFRALRVVDLRENGIGPRGATALAGWSAIERLTRINLYKTVIGDEGFAALLQSPRTMNLCDLNVADNGIGDVGARALADHAPATLRSVDLFANLVGPDGAVVMARAERLAALEWLGLENNPLTPEGAQALLDSPHLNERITSAIRQRWFNQRKTAFDVVVMASGDKMVPVLKALREVTG